MESGAWQATVHGGHKSQTQLNNLTITMYVCVWNIYVLKLNAPCVNLYAEYIMWNASLDEAQAGIKIVGRNIKNLSYAGDMTLWQKVKRH